MYLTERFWKTYELDLQEVKLSYLNWAIGYATEPLQKYRHLFLWNHQKQFSIVNSRYGRSFAISPFGSGVRGVPRKVSKYIPRGLDEIDIELKSRLKSNTHIIRNSIRDFVDTGDFESARDALLNFYWQKLISHELMYDRIIYGQDETGKIVKGKINTEEPEDHKTLTGIRNRIINVIRFGENLEPKYVKSLNKKLPGFSGNSHNTFIASGLTWNRYGLCAFDCGPVLWSKKGFVSFNQVRKRMKKIGWPYQGSPSELLRPLYTIAVNYRRPPIRLRNGADEGYSLKSIRKRRCQFYRIIDN
ncbi:MAG: hypothetical protein DNFNHJIP_00582 [Candidatus Argoarchaeum ethanivorans]|uniref:Uncharacterized protein n=1 Tax=Candidatus Argoarchaeum ethanivorans TaxID=2608793 RepID=A0A812A304_9EURY|nr:MAG: hypothetical protein DNFNHJIP_00582 [Candidatus Argoarchaeum ethanivorans]